MKNIYYIILFVNLFYYVYEDIILYNLGKLRKSGLDPKKNLFKLIQFPSYEGILDIFVVAFVLSSLSTITVFFIEKLLK